jgi:hypothetical protein
MNLEWTMDKNKLASIRSLEYNSVTIDVSSQTIPKIIKIEISGLADDVEAAIREIRSILTVIEETTTGENGRVTKRLLVEN